MERDDQEMKRLKTTAFQGDNNNNPPQKCPRCESMNTKFCYYNNYSLSQPRYFCKTCRRYWTQGGTLRNVPVGGGCRKGKRLKTTAAAPPPSAANTAIAANLSSNKELGQTNLMNSGPIGSLYPAGGFLSSLAAIQSFSNTNNSIPQQLPMNHVDLGGFSTSNLNLLNGFNGGVPPFGSNQQRPFYPNGFNPIVPDTALWSTISTSTTNSANNSGNINIAANNATATNSATASFPMNPSDNQWQDLSSYGNSPP